MDRRHGDVTTTTVGSWVGPDQSKNTALQRKETEKERKAELQVDKVVES